MKNKIKRLTGNEYYKLAAKDEKVFCPKCGAELVVIADRSGEVIKPHSITCPVNSAHFDILYEDAEKVQAIRRSMKKMAAATNAKNDKI